MTKGFDNLEFEMRVKRARELMEKNNIDILLLTTHIIFVISLD